MARYGIATVTVLIGLTLRMVLNPFLEYEARFILFVPAIIISGFYGGIGPSLFASVASLILANRFALSATWLPRDLHDLMAGFAYVFSALVVAGLANAVRWHTQRVRDEIMERKRVASELLRSEERFRKIFECAAVGVVQVDVAGQYVHANPTYCRIIGYSLKELQELTLFDVTHPDDRPTERKLFQKAISGELPVYQNERRCLRKTGEVIWIRATTSFLRDSQGRAELSINVVEDVTRQKLAEEALRQSREKLQAIMDNSPSIVFVKDIAGRYLLSNRQFEVLIHGPASEIIGKTDRDIFPAAQAEVYRANDLKVLESGTALEFEETAIHDDGPHISIVNKFPLRDETGKIYATGGIVTDITQRKQAEERLRKIQEGYANLVSTVDGIVWEAHPKSLAFSFVSQKAERLLLYPAEQWVNEPDFWKKHLHPDDREWAVAFCQKASQEKRNHDFEYRMIAADGRIVWLRDIVRVVEEANGVVKLRGVMVDITEQKRAQAVLEENEEKLRVLTETATDAIISADSQGNVIQFNGAAERIFGYSESELWGQPIVCLIPERFRKACREGLAQFLATGENRLIGKTADSTGLRKNGTEFPMEFSLSSWKASTGIFFTVIVRDISERKQVMEALGHSEQLLRMTTEAAGVGLWSWDVAADVLEWNPIEYQQCALRSDTPMNAQAFLNCVHPEDRARVKAEMESSLRDGHEVNMEYRIVWPDGTIRWRHCKGRPTYADDRAVRLSGMSLDITARKEAEEALRRSEELLRMTTEGAGIDLWNWDVVADFLECPSLHEPFRFEGPVNLETYINHVHPEDRDRLRAEVTRCIEENAEFNIEFRVVWPNGSIGWRHSKGRPFYQNGRAVRFSGISIDVTARKEAEEALRRNEQLLRITTEAAEIGLWNWNMIKNTVEWNRIEYEQFGLDPGTPVTLQTFLDGVHPEDRAGVKTEIERCIRERCDLDIEHRILLSDGTIRWNQCRGRVVQTNKHASYFGGMSLDITERKQTQESLRQSEERLRLATEFTDTGLWDWDLITDKVRWTTIVSRHLGCPSGDETNYAAFLNCLHPEDRVRVDGELRYCVAANAPFDSEYRVVWPNGSVHWIWAKAHLVLNHEGRPVRFLGTTMEITARRQVEEALRRQAELLDIAQVIVTDLHFKIIFWNHGAEQVYGWTREEAMGKIYCELLRTELPEPLPKIQEELYNRGHWQGELKQVRRNGEQVVIAAHWAIHKDAQNRAVAILESHSDITALKQTERELEEARNALAAHAGQLEQQVAARTAELQKSLKDMEAFLYTMAHDLRAPLRAMRGFTSALAEEYGEQLGETAAFYCERIRSSANRMDQLISDLLAFGRLSHLELPTKLVDLTEEIEKVLARSAPDIEEKHAQVEVEKPLPKVCADGAVLDQVLENLIINAVKFVPPETPPRIHIYAEPHQDNVRVWVEDNGIGIAPEHQEKIFGTFERLHTAESYPGTGIGLAIVKRGVEKMGGHVGVESIPGKGSRFWIELPSHTLMPC